MRSNVCESLTHVRPVPYREDDMTQPTRSDVPSMYGVGVESGSSRNGQPIFHRTQLELTITVEKIDRFLEEIQQRITLLQQDATNLAIVRAQVVSRKAHKRRR